MGTKVYLSDADRPVDPGDARISVFDRGFLYGDSVYETMRTAGGRPLELERHLARLRRSAAGIGLDIPGSDGNLESILATTHEATGNRESQLRLIVTRGTGPLMLDPRASQSPSIVVIAKPLVLPAESEVRAGIRAAVVTVSRGGAALLDATIKSGNYLGNILALREAVLRGADDAILCDVEGFVAEGATSNVFLVEGQRLATPALGAGLLPGITREVVCGLAEGAGIVVDQTSIDIPRLRSADEVFLTSSVRGIMPVTRLDDRVVSAGVQGPVTARVRGLYANYLACAGG